MNSLVSKIAIAAVAVLLTASQASAENAPPVAAAPENGGFLLTVFLKHDQSKPLEQLDTQLRQQGFYKAFPPPGVEVVSWYVMMGIGQVVTLRVPPDKLREVNRAIEQTAWGAFHTEFYPTYDLKSEAGQMHAKAQ
jgi:hypothetical protein